MKLKDREQKAIEVSCREQQHLTYRSVLFSDACQRDNLLDCQSKFETVEGVSNAKLRL